MGSKLIKGILVVSALFFCPACLISAIGASTFLIGSSPNDVDIQVEAPSIAVKETSFVIRVEVTNEADEVQTLDSIDLLATDLELMQFVASTPAYQEEEIYIGLRSYYYGEDIQPGETLDVSLDAVAYQTGIFQYEIDICINTGFSCQTVKSDIVVR